MKLSKVMTSKGANTQAFFNVLGPIILNGINFFTIPIFTRLLGTENYGILAIYTTWVQVLSIIIGLQTCGTIATASVYIPQDENKKYLSSILSLSFLSFISISVVVLILIGPISQFTHFSNIVIILILLQSFGTFCVQFANAKFVFHREGIKTFSLSITISLVTVLLSLAAIKHINNFNERYLGKVYGTAIPYIVFGIIIMVVFLSKGKTFYNKKYWLFCLPLSIPLVFNGLSGIILSQCDKIMLQQYTTDSIVGIYSFAFTFAHVLTVLLDALNNTWMPFYFDYVSSGNIDILNRKTKNYINVFTILASGFILLSPEVIKIFASSDFWSGINLIPILVFGMYMIFLYNFPVNFQIYHKKTSTIALGTIAASVINVLLNFVLVPRFNMYGATIATFCSYFFLFLFHELISKYLLKQGYSYSIKTFIGGILSITVICAIYYIFINMWFIRWGLGFILGCALLYKIIKQRSVF